MIKGSATIQFGSGSVASVGCIHKESGMGAVCMRSCAPGKIVTDASDDTEGRIDFDLVTEEPEVVVYFTNIESLDVQISMLTDIRQRMAEFKSVEEKR